MRRMSRLLNRFLSGNATDLKCCKESQTVLLVILICLGCTGVVRRMSYRKLSRARSGHQISCPLVSFHFLCDILRMTSVVSCPALISRSQSCNTSAAFPEKMFKLRVSQCGGTLLHEAHPVFPPPALLPPPEDEDRLPPPPPAAAAAAADPADPPEIMLLNDLDPMLLPPAPVPAAAADAAPLSGAGFVFAADDMKDEK